jgi:hypothetical protein
LSQNPYAVKKSMKEIKVEVINEIIVEKALPLLKNHKALHV